MADNEPTLIAFTLMELKDKCATDSRYEYNRVVPCAECGVALGVSSSSPDVARVLCTDCGVTDVVACKEGVDWVMTREQAEVVKQECSMSERDMRALCKSIGARIQEDN